MKIIFKSSSFRNEENPVRIYKFRSKGNLIFSLALLERHPLEETEALRVSGIASITG